MTAHIVVVRDSGWRGLWSGRFAVRVDGERVGRLSHGANQDYEVAPGTHRVRVSQFGYASRTLAVSVTDGETTVLRSRIRFWANYLNCMMGCLVGGSAVRLFEYGPTPTNVTTFAIGAAGVILLYASKLLIRLRLDPAGSGMPWRP